VGDIPSGTVTFLFTDIEGSTRLWEERPDEMRAALAENDVLLRTAIEGAVVMCTPRVATGSQRHFHGQRKEQDG
jgi:hypothetical protein